MAWINGQLWSECRAESFVDAALDELFELVKAMNMTTLTKPEIRYFQAEEVRMEGEDTPAPKVVGYGAVFNSMSDDLGGFREIIRPHAFQRCLASNRTSGSSSTMMACPWLGRSRAHSNCSGSTGLAI